MADQPVNPPNPPTPSPADSSAGGAPVPPQGGQASIPPVPSSPPQAGAPAPGQAAVPTSPEPPQPTAPPDPNARVGQLKTRQGHIFTIPPHPNTTFDEEYFLTLLEGSISLTMEEKQRVIEAIPRLRIEQINELISIFEEEKQKFSELESEFADDVNRLKQEREKEIEITENKKEESKEDAAAADEAAALRASLMKDDD